MKKKRVDLDQEYKRIQTVVGLREEWPAAAFEDGLYDEPTDLLWSIIEALAKLLRPMSQSDRALVLKHIARNTKSLVRELDEEAESWRAEEEARNG